MNSTFYNGKVSFVTKEPYNGTLPNYFVPFYGNKHEVYTKIKQYEYENDQFFNAHLFVNDFDNYKFISDKCNLAQLTENYLDAKLALFFKVWHNSVHSKNIVDDSVALLSSFNLAFYCYADRTKCSTYSNLARHRVGVSNFKYLSEKI